jgi:hypothetical protein
MADVAISYAHSTVAIAAELRDRLFAAGISVWMDDPGDIVSSAVGVPVGFSHWDLIRTEFAAATLIVALDCEQWRASAYCQKEHRWCLRLGKPLAFVPLQDAPDAVIRIEQLLAARRLESEAHARLAARYAAAHIAAGTDNNSDLDPDPDSDEAGQVADPDLDEAKIVAVPAPTATWLQRVVFGRHAYDAERARDAQGAPFDVTPTIRAVIDTDLKAAEDTRRGLLRLATGGVAGLAVLAVFAIAGWLIAGIWSGEAAASERAARSLELVQQAGVAVGTVDAVMLAEEAVRLDPATSSIEALRAARLRDQRLRVIELPPSDFKGGAWAPDVPVVVAYTADHVTVIDVEKGEVSNPVKVDSRISLNRLVVGPGGRTAVYADATTGQLRLLDLTDGTSKVLAVHGRIIALSLTADERLAWGTDDGSVGIGPYPQTAGELVIQASVVIPAFARAIDVVGNTVAVVSDDGWARQLRVEGDALVEDAAVVVSEHPHSDSLGGYRAGVTICGDTVSGSFLGATLLGTRFRWNPGTETTAETVPATLETRPLCAGDGVLHASAVRGDIEDFSRDISVLGPADVARNLSVFDPAHERAAFLSPSPGRLVIVDPANAVTERQLGSMNALVVLRDRTLVVDGKHNVVDLDSGDRIGRIGEVSPVPHMTAVSGCNALVSAADGVYRLSCTGEPEHVADATELRRIRAASHGEGFVLARESSIDLLTLHGVLERTIELDWLGEDVVADADLSPDGTTVVVITVLGLLYEFSVDGASAAPESFATVPTGNGNAVAYLPDDAGIVVLSADARLSRFVEGAVVAARQLDFHALGLFVDDGLVLASSLPEGTAVLDANTLAPVERYERGFFADTTSRSGDALGLSFAYASVSGGGDIAGILVTVPPIG